MGELNDSEPPGQSVNTEPLSRQAATQATPKGCTLIVEQSRRPYMSQVDEDGQVGQGNSLYAALARTLTRSAALYFARPVRLFRPSKGERIQCLQMFVLQIRTGFESDGMDVSTRIGFEERTYSQPTIHF